jgi:NAD+ kinase
MANDREAYLILDGHEGERLRRGDVVQVTRGEHLFRMIVTEQMNFYEAFQSKFNYLIRPGAVPSLGHERPAP